MLTFLEFYQTFISFINYRLYTSVNLVYPPKLDIDKDDAGAGLSAYLIQSGTDSEPVATQEPMKNILPVKDTTEQRASLPSKLASLTDVAEDTSSEKPAKDDDALDTFTSADPTAVLPQPATSITETTNTLFSSLHVYLSRETPVDALTFLLLSFNVSSLSTDPITGPSPYPESDPRITHQICDRGRLPDAIVPGRKYVQPQWIVDSINRGVLLDESEYIPGAELPPHLSPFVEKVDGKYDPEEELEVESEEEVEDEDEDAEVDPDTEHQRLVLAEAAGQTAIETKSKKKKRKEVDEEKEAKEMAKIMMTNKNKRLLQAMEYGNNKRKGETEKLQGRKRELIREERKRKKVKLA
jgi:pescadillo